MFYMIAYLCHSHRIFIDNYEVAIIALKKAAGMFGYVLGVHQVGCKVMLNSCLFKESIVNTSSDGFFQ